MFHHLVAKAKKQGEAFTALDAMKLFAIINMTADHIGAYLFPEIMWFRAIGRITFPVWFFLVGYSTSRLIPKQLWAYAGLLVLLQPFVGYPILPLNALVTVILCRLVLNLCTDKGWFSKYTPEIITAFVVLSLFTVLLFEYGSVAFLYALLGRVVSLKQPDHLTKIVFWAYVSFIFLQLLPGTYNLLQIIYIVLGTAWVVQWLSRCPNNVIWPNWTQNQFKVFIAVLSRNTLPYYFYHRVILQMLAAWLLGKTFILAFS